ncbi:MAG: lysophospholipid acyltransferase family protein [Alphaproteobacteria bacterium]|jgi:lysophospholipid acyltransferase (LPLAT)-like uncharacterized protein
MLKRLSKNNFFLNLFANLVFLSLWIIKSTSNWKGVNEQIIEKELTKKKTLIVLIWHHQLMGSTFSWKFKPKLRPIATSHRDGQLSTLVQKKFGLDPLLRKKDNPTFLIKNISKAVQNEDCIYITPDAPHGPPKKINTNIFKLCQKFDLNIAILSFHTNRYFRINSWDKLKIPLPFSKGIYLWGNEIIQSKEFKNEIDFNKKISDELNKNSERINDYF